VYHILEEAIAGFLSHLAKAHPLVFQKWGIFKVSHAQMRTRKAQLVTKSRRALQTQEAPYLASWGSKLKITCFSS
jgi:hypothetical protein